MAKNAGIVKELTKYEKSDEFKSILEYSKEQQEILRVKNRDILSKREKVEFIGTYLNEKLEQINVLNDFIWRITNEHFKKYLETRIRNYESSIDNGEGREELLSTQIDLNKVARQEYFAIKFYLQFAIDMYTKWKEKDFYKELDPYC